MTIQQVCKKYNLSRLYLISIIKLYSKGIYRVRIAKRLGISKTTVVKYISLLREMSPKEIKEVYGYSLNIF